jgi:hypothetical protein
MSAFSILIAFAAQAMPARAQSGDYVEGISEITSETTAQTLDTYSGTYMTYGVCLYYNAHVHAAIYQNDTKEAESSADGGSDYCWAELDGSGPITLGDTYTQVADHSIYAVYWVNYGGQTYYENPFQYSGFYPGSPDPSGTDYPSDGGGDYYMVSETIEVGQTAAWITAAAPTISDISPSVGTVGTSGSITVDGEYLIDPWTETATPVITGSGVSLSLGANPSDQQLSLNYSIAQGATTGPQSLTLATRFGASNAATFTVGYPAAHVTSLNPPTWQAGQSFTLTINGTGFGTAPTVNISGAAGVQYGQAMNTNPQGTQTQVSVTIQPDAPNGTATLTVIPGYAGSTFYCGNCNGGSPNGTDFATVVAAQNSCPAQLDAHSGFAGIVPTGTAGGSGTMTASFSGGAFDGNSVTVPYGQYSTPESIASHIAALITKHYYNSGLSAQAIGSQILYKSTAVLGTPTLTGSGASFTKDTSTACPPANMKYVLAVLSDSVTWKSEGMDNGRWVVYSLEYWPKTMGSLGQATPFPNAIVAEHLTNSMAYGTSTHGDISGQFTDILGNTSGMNSGTYVTDRYFTVNSSGQDLGHIRSYDRTGTHDTDHIVIHLPTGPSILNNWTNSDGSPKDISIP